MSTVFYIKVSNPPHTLTPAPRDDSSNKLSDLSLKTPFTDHFHRSSHAARTHGNTKTDNVPHIQSLHATIHAEKKLIEVPLTHLMRQDGSVDVDVAVSHRHCRRFSALCQSAPKRGASFIPVPSHRVRFVSVPYLSFTDYLMLTLLTPLSLPPVLLPPAVLPSGHSLELLTETGYVAKPRER